MLKRTPLYNMHRALGARMMEFAGWEMPVWYSGIIEEHHAVRDKAGLFDVSHMGEIIIEGPGALATLQRVITNDASKLGIGQVLYAVMCNGKGGILDDLTVYRRGETRWLLVVNAVNAERDYRWIMQHKATGTTVRNISDEVGLLALQGHLSQVILSELTTCDLSSIKYYHFRASEICNMLVLFSRTGYTGEDGFEIYCDWQNTEEIWSRILEAGRSYGIMPCGLGSRDTLRLEAGMRLYGNDIDEKHTPLEAGLSWIVKFDKPSYFIGKAALVAQAKRGIARQLVGFEVKDPAIARRHHEIFDISGEKIGVVTSGAPSPTLGKNIGMGYVRLEYAEPKTQILISIRGERRPAKVVSLPFYKRRGDGPTIARKPALSSTKRTN